MSVNFSAQASPTQMNHIVDISTAMPASVSAEIGTQDNWCRFACAAPLSNPYHHIRQDRM